MRIPLGGVASFKNDRSLRSKVLSHIPAIRPRWRRRPSYSFSDISDSDLDSLAFPVPRELGFGNGDDDDDDDDDDVLSDIFSDTLTEGSGQGGGQDLSDVFFLLESVNVESQQAILDQILRERERASGQPWVEEVLQDPGDPATLGVAREVELPPGGRAGEHWPVPGGLTSEEEELQAAVTLALRMDWPDHPPLDIAVVLGLISDLEEHGRLEDVAGQATSETTEEKQAAQPPTETTAAAQALSAQRPACRRRENTRSYTTNEDPASQAEERPDDQPEDEDCKHKAIASPGIPRPKLVTLANPDERRTRTQQGEEEEEGALGGICPGVLRPQTATVGLASCQEDLAPAAERWRRLEVQSLGMQATQEEACRGRQPDWTLPQVPGERKDQGHQRPEAFDPKQKTSPAVNEGKMPTTFLSPELESEGWGTHDAHPNLALEAERSVPERGRKWLSAYRHEETSKGLLPEEWRLEELRRMEMARARTQWVEGEEDLGLDVMNQNSVYKENFPVYGSATPELTVKNTLAVRFNNDSAYSHLQ